MVDGLSALSQLGWQEDSTKRVLTMGTVDFKLRNANTDERLISVRYEIPTVYSQMVEVRTTVYFQIVEVKTTVYFQMVDERTSVYFQMVEVRTTGTQRSHKSRWPSPLNTTEVQILPVTSKTVMKSSTVVCVQ